MNLDSERKEKLKFILEIQRVGKEVNNAIKTRKSQVDIHFSLSTVKNKGFLSVLWITKDIALSFYPLVLVGGFVQEWLPGLRPFELTLLNLLYFFDWKLPEEKKDMDMEESGDVTVVKKVPLELIPILRH
ncbi:hypothetical protein ISN45_Aa05g004200 [Arabidopsis thaliana x Arabidopsis arenosa]|uniref:Uncharacterized protein n=1 Tax=Arabidopsis thaliana x Arabidopsis arenosa TaxID=1240361 RepID=A0A8T1ZH67_9BRAS|nr:hypothetical protein ISN45_Aa05g004200 [Arabidopsis thaliana x Arabidopsis arenosa]